MDATNTVDSVETLIVTDNETLIHNLGNEWYVDTPAGPSGPLASHQEAKDYLALLDRVSAAGVECACFEPDIK